ncbi:DNA-binding transcriptional regulator, LacI/PurR family [Amycolatopsis tolypomycina]|uniref:DNA-binding transcriptional regulator, LacI/PurR family n=1 Tax=Amycolatopsis tolypomycina TaxID=208445 RepID=A0A1H4WCP9_9PSEU|nr:substrate-binding domain-containing protein [Amycolatopsis tolypomycina]SEC91063.1 DNA-binding transcriptional regulator, LacI/PurR family [Amycolatopsis tolypomycina]
MPVDDAGPDGPLPLRRRGMLGVIATGSSASGPVLHGLRAAAREQEYVLSVFSVSSKSSAAVLAAVAGLQLQGVAGIVVLDGYLLAELAPVAGIPLVPAASTDQYAGARQATEHLLELGHPTVWHLGGPEEGPVARARERGWRETLERHGAEVPPVVRGDWSARSGFRAGQSLAVESGVGAVFSANDHMALGLLAAFAEAGMRVPRDAHVVGFDDVPEAAYFAPPLTTVRQDYLAAGRRTLATVSARIDGVPVPAWATVEAELVVRESSRCLKGA